MSRPILPKGEKREMIVIRMHPKIIKRLDALAKAEGDDPDGISRARMVEHLVSRAEMPTHKKKKRVSKKDPKPARRSH